MIDSSRPVAWKADLALAVVALVWGATFVVVKGALAEISTMYFLALRFSLATLCLLPLLFRVPPKSLGPGLTGGLVAGCFLTLGYVLQTFGLLYTSAGNSGFLTGLYIVMVPLITAAIYRRWPRKIELGGVVIASVGIALLTFPADGASPSLNRGDLLTLGCALAFAIHLLVLGYYSRRCSVEALAVGQIGCTAALSGIALFFSPPHAQWSVSLIGAIAITGVFATALAFVLQTWGQRYTSNTRAAVIFSLEPVFALAAAVLTGGERLTWRAVAGGALILGSILSVELYPAQRTSEES